MKISKVETFNLHVPVTGSRITDSTHDITHWGVPGAIIHTECGLRGYGFAGTHAHLPTDRLITDCIQHTYAPLLVGEDAHDVQRIWRKMFLFPPSQWVGRSGITHIALGTIDTALWDLKAKAANLPLWKLLGGNRKTGSEAYNTDGGWLNIPIDQLTDNCRRFVQEDGYLGVKIKIGSPDPNDDLRRIEAVRNAIGPKVKFMVDANGKWNLPEAVNNTRKFTDYDLYFIEEPLWYDDIEGHAALADAIETPIALGEQVYSLDMFKAFLREGAVHFLQPDITRLGGVTEWLRVADLAFAHRLPVAPHAGDMGQVHVHLGMAHPAVTLVEYIPWIRHCFEEPMTVKDGYFVPPQLPGAATTPTAEALQKYGVK